MITAADAAQTAADQLDAVIRRLTTDTRWTKFRPATYHDRITGLDVETRYCYGESRVIVTRTENRRTETVADLKFLGRDTAAEEEFSRLFS